MSNCYPILQKMLLFLLKMIGLIPKSAKMLYLGVGNYTSFMGLVAFWCKTEKPINNLLYNLNKGKHEEFYNESCDRGYCS